jgi:hypothetical protein
VCNFLFRFGSGLNRCGKSCRLRWLNYLRPDIKRGGYTEQEDHIICSLYNSIGSRYAPAAFWQPLHANFFPSDACASADPLTRCF